MLKSYIMDTDGNVKLARHFKVKEFACKDGSQVIFIDDYLYTVLDILRHKLGKPVTITTDTEHQNGTKNAVEQNTAIICAVWRQISGKME